MLSRKSPVPNFKQRLVTATTQAYAALDRLTRPRIVTPTQLQQYQCHAKCYSTPNVDLEEMEKCAQMCDPKLTVMRTNVNAVAKEIQEALAKCSEDCGKQVQCTASCVDSFEKAWETLIAELESTD